MVVELLRSTTSLLSMQIIIKQTKIITAQKGPIETENDKKREMTVAKGMA